MNDRPIRLDIIRTALPMRTFEHAAATRSLAEAIIVRLRTESGRTGWGESLPRPYLTGETLESVPADIESIFWPRLKSCRSTRDVQRLLPDLPIQADARTVAAARCAVELAAIQAFDLHRPAKPVPPSLWPAVTGVIGSSDPQKTARKLRLMRWYGLKHFKLKLGFSDDVDRANLRQVVLQLRKGLATGKYNLRVDANNAWPFSEVTARVAELKEQGVSAVEQPCKLRASRFVDLAFECSLPLIADESLITNSDAEVLMGAEGKIWPNVRIAKNGGLIPAARLAKLAHENGTPLIIGCLVGESGILSLAQRCLLAGGASPVMLEGNYGKWLLNDDLTTPSLRFGLSGRIRPENHLAGRRFNPSLDGAKLKRYGQLLTTLQQ